MKKEIKRLMKEYKSAVKKADALDAAWEEDYENEELEAAWTAAYEAEHEAFDKLVDALVLFSLGKLTQKTAGTLLRMKFDEVNALIARLA